MQEKVLSKGNYFEIKRKQTCLLAMKRGEIIFPSRIFHSTAKFKIISMDMNFIKI